MERFTAVEGDSFYTLPEFVKENPTFECDVVFVDGGHEDIVPYSDMRHFQASECCRGGEGCVL